MTTPTTYDELVEQTSTGQTPRPAVILSVLSAAGKTPADLIRDASEMRTRRLFAAREDAPEPTIPRRSNAAKRSSVVGLLTRNPQRSNREIARLAGVSLDLVNRVRRTLEQTGRIARTTTRLFKRGGKQFSIRVGQQNDTCEDASLGPSNGG